VSARVGRGFRNRADTLRQRLKDATKRVPPSPRRRRPCPPAERQHGGGPACPEPEPRKAPTARNIKARFAGPGGSVGAMDSRLRGNDRVFCAGCSHWIPPGAESVLRRVECLGRKWSRHSRAGGNPESARIAPCLQSAGRMPSRAMRMRRSAALHHPGGDRSHRTSASQSPLPPGEGNASAEWRKG